MAITRIPVGHEDAGGQPSSAPTASLHQHSLSNASTATVDVEAWTVAALESLSISPIARGAGNALSFSLDADPLSISIADGGRASGSTRAPAARMASVGVRFRGAGDAALDDALGASFTPLQPTPPRRDSMRRRDALVKGKEGSRQRRRWENDHLVHVPNVVPPLPSDFQILPTHRVLPPVPYQLAQYWDLGLRERAEAQKQKRQRNRNRNRGRGSKHKGDGDDEGGGGDEQVGRVPRDLRATVKRTPAAKSWLRLLEPPVREFVVRRGLAVAAPAAAVSAGAENGGGSSSSDETDPDDDEIVFVGRNGAMRDGKPIKSEPARRAGAAGEAWKPAQRHVVAGEERRVVESGMVLELEEGGGGAFQRWLTHSISDYYGLDSRSVMVGNPTRRVIYVGAKQKQTQTQTQPSARHKPVYRPVLPPPLWEML